ncbi:MAG: sugar nucleotide-binding protein [Vicinamibacteraceae bacterium]|nr:sugar nucleotide-binding protein [Vicinamibacteraceae bacterium]
MRVFLTGGTGYIGSAILDALVRHGHEVTALVRRPETAERLGARGVQSLVADLEALPSLGSALGGSQAYVHAAFEPSPRGVELEQRAVEALVATARTSPGTALVYVSGIWVLGDTATPAGEDAPTNPTALTAWRPALEQAVLATAGDGVRPAVVRPGIVYGGGRGIVGEFIRDAANGLMRVVGTGQNHWPVVYDRDVAELVARILADTTASGVYHAVDEQEQTVGEIAQAIAEFAPGKPSVRFMPIAEARQKMGAYADALALDQRVACPRSRAIGWAPSLSSITRNVPRLFEEWRTANRPERGSP